jgi:hypothetical protein
MEVRLPIVACRIRCGFSCGSITLADWAPQAERQAAGQRSAPCRLPYGVPPARRNRSW